MGKKIKNKKLFNWSVGRKIDESSLANMKCGATGASFISDRSDAFYENAEHSSQQTQLRSEWKCRGESVRQDIESSADCSGSLTFAC